MISIPNVVPHIEIASFEYRSPKVEDWVESLFPTTVINIGDHQIRIVKDPTMPPNVARIGDQWILFGEEKT